MPELPRSTITVYLTLTNCASSLAGAYAGGFEGVRMNPPFFCWNKEIYVLTLLTNEVEQKKFLYSLYSLTRLSIYSALERITIMWVRLIAAFLRFMGTMRWTKQKPLMPYLTNPPLKIAAYMYAPD